MLVFLYNLYLKYGASTTYYPDIITHLVARQSEFLIAGFGYNASIEPSTIDPSMTLSIDGQILGRIVEGCNAVSVIILFIAFMISFFGGWRRTLLYSFAGMALIYTINIVRIALLTVGIHEYPAYSEVLHGTIFPAIIYGSVLLLWLGWVRSYQKTANAN